MGTRTGIGGKPLPNSGWRLRKLDDEIEHGPSSHSILPELVDEKDEDSKVPRIVQWAVGVLICVNAAFLGVCTNATQDDTKTNALCQDSENVFAAAFLLEFLIKLYFLRLAYFCSLWNWLDFLLLLFSILDIWILTPIMGTDGGGATQMGKGMVLRLFRLVRVLRLFKLLGQRKELLILIEGLGAAFQSMIWVAILLTLVIYGASLFAVSVFRDVQTDCDIDFSDVPMAMFAMFTVGTLADWTAIVSPVTEQYAWAGIFFIAFALLTNFAMLNLVIGVITERTQLVNQKYERIEAHHYDSKRLKVVESLGEMLFDGSGRSFITSADLYDIIHNQEAGERIQELIAEVDLPIGFTVQDLHGMLDRAGRGRVSRHDFVHGMAGIMFGSEFQQNCLIQAALAALRTQITSVLEDAVGRLRADLASVASPRVQIEPPQPPEADGSQERCEELLKSVGAGLPAVSGVTSSAASLRAELEKLVGEITAGCNSWSSLAHGVLLAGAAPLPERPPPPLPHFREPPEVRSAPLLGPAPEYALPPFPQIGALIEVAGSPQARGGWALLGGGPDKGQPEPGQGGAAAAAHSAPQPALTGEPHFASDDPSVVLVRGV